MTFEKLIEAASKPQIRKRPDGSEYTVYGAFVVLSNGDYVGAGPDRVAGRSIVRSHIRWAFNINGKRTSRANAIAALQQEEEGR